MKPGSLSQGSVTARQVTLVVWP